MTILDDFLGLIFPDLCAACGNPLWKNERIICAFCDFRLPRTSFHLCADNPLSRIFRGRCRVESAAAYLYFNKGNRVQQLVHALKYKGRKEIGTWLGNEYGRLLSSSPFFNHADYIIPVPLHPEKLRLRGFNQSEQFAVGLGTAMNLPVETGTLSRCSASATQTRKSRFLRWQNVEDIFAVSPLHPLQGKQVLLVDDVITTGATIESCIMALEKIPDIRISVAAMAVSMT